jgi:ParB family chromosome partitioning protein
MPEGALPLHRLTDPNGQSLDDEAHAICPGHVVTLDPWNYEPRAVYCLDPARNGHDRHHPGAEAGSAGATAPDSRDEARAERRRIIDGNRDWRAARHVRREFLRVLLARRTPPKGTLRYVVEAIVAEPSRLADGNEALMTELLGPAPNPPTWGRAAGPHAAKGATDARLPLVALAQVGAAAETALTDHTWRERRPAGAAKWLSWLNSVGYTLSDIETRVIEAGQKPDPYASPNHDDTTDGG